MSAGYKSADQTPRLTVNVRFMIREGLFATWARGLRHEQENRQRAKQGQIARRRGVAHGAAVFVLGAIPAIVLAIFNAPVVAGQRQQSLRSGLLRPVSGHGVNDLIGFFDYFALAHLLNVAMDTDDLGHPG